MAYFTRTEDTMEDINNSLLRGKSLDGWQTFGKDVWVHIYFADHLTVKKIYKDLLNSVIVFQTITQEDRVEAYQILVNEFHIKHSGDKDKYIHNLQDDLIYRTIHPVYRDILYKHNFAPHTLEKEITLMLDLEPFEQGYIKYLAGLCALEKFENEPMFSDCAKKLTSDNGNPYLLNYLVCLEGEEVGIDKGDDWGEEWVLFKPTRIVWVHDGISKNTRIMQIDKLPPYNKVEKE